MALNIRPFEGNWRRTSDQGIRPALNGDWGPPNMAQQIQQGIASLYGAYQGARKDANEETQAEAAARALERNRQVSVTPGAPNAYAGNTGSVSQSTYDAAKPLAANLDPLVKDVAQRYGIDENYARQLIQIESAGDPRATSSTGAKGLTQFTGGTWKTYGQGDPYDPAANLDAFGKLTTANRADLTGRLGRAPTPGELYLAHQQGAAGAGALLANPSQNAVEALAGAYGGDRGKALRAITVNGGNPNMTAGEFASKWVNRFPGGGGGTAVAGAGEAPGARAASGQPAGVFDAAAVKGLNPQLLQVAELAARRNPGLIALNPDTAQVRTPEQQQEYVDKGWSKTLNSQHLPGNAIDVVPINPKTGKPDANYREGYAKVAAEMRRAAAELGVSGLEWGGDWKGFTDRPHWQLAGSKYDVRTQQPTATAAAATPGPTAQATPPATPVAAGQPQAVASAVPGVVTRTPVTDNATASGTNQQPLFQTPQMAQATSAAPAGNSQQQQAQQPPPPQLQNPLAGSGGDTNLVGGTMQPRVADDPGLGPQGRAPVTMPTPDVLTTGSVDPTAPAATGPAPPLPPPRPPGGPQAAPAPQAAATPAQAPQAPPVPPQVAQAAGASPTTYQMSVADPDIRAAMAAAIRSRNPAVMNAVNAYAERLTAAQGTADWTLEHDNRGNWFQHNKRTGEARPFAVPGQQAGGLGSVDPILQPGDPRRVQLGIDKEGQPPDRRPWRLTTDDKGNVKPEPISPADERETKAPERIREYATAWEGNKSVQDYRQLENAVAGLGGALGQGNGISDMVAVVQLFKAIDPNSTVSATETANAQTAGGVDNRLWGFFNQLQGGGSLTPELRARMYNVAKQILEERREGVQSFTQGWQNRARSAGLNPDDVTGGWKPREFTRADPKQFVDRNTDGTPRTGGKLPGETKKTAVPVQSVDEAAKVDGWWVYMDPATKKLEYGFNGGL